jgi:hypothetical protein
MSPLPSFGGSGGGDGFDDDDAFVAENLPAPGPHLEGHDVLTGDAHVEVHEIARELFEERGVYDVTFGYNLARLNQDRRHPDAGFRYALDADDPAVLRAEFTPTTEFCPQGLTLARGASRAWNGLSDRHGYDSVSVRLHPMHQNSDSVNDELAALESGDGGDPDREPDAAADGDTRNLPF